MICDKAFPFTGDYALGGIFNAHVYYRQKDGNFGIHYSGRAHKWLLIAEDAGLVIDEIDGSIILTMTSSPRSAAPVGTYVILTTGSTSCATLCM